MNSVCVCVCVCVIVYIDTEEAISHRGSNVKGRVLKCLGSNPVTTLGTEEINKSKSFHDLDINSEATESGGGKKGLQIEIKEDPEGLVLEFVRRFQYATCLTGLITSCLGTAL